MDDDMWDRNRMHTSLKMSLRYPLDALNPYNVLGVIESGSPLSRGWNPWHLRPKRLEHDPELLASRHISQVTQALAVTKRQVKRFKYETLLNNGISPMVFSMFEITDPFAHCMSTALCRLELLELQITPCESQLTNKGSANGLGFLPQLLEQLTGLKRLRLTLETAERVTQRGNLSSLRSLDDSCFNYTQVFPGHGRWPHLKMLHLRGLAIDALDLLILLFKQMLQLERVWLNRIDLLGGSWEGIVEAVKSCAWEIFSLQGQLRHNGREWWPCSPDNEREEHRALQKYMQYIYNGGRHPSLPPDCHDSSAVSYVCQMFLKAGYERHQAFYNRAHEVL